MICTSGVRIRCLSILLRFNAGALPLHPAKGMESLWNPEPFFIISLWDIMKNAWTASSPFLGGMLETESLI